MEESSHPYAGAASKEGRSMRFWISVAVIAITVLFIAVNAQEVKVNFIVGDAQLPLIFALALSVGLGAVLGYVMPKLRNDKKED